MIRAFLRWLWGSTALTPETPAEPRERLFSTHFDDMPAPRTANVTAAVNARLKADMPRPIVGGGWGQDGAGSLSTLKTISDPDVGAVLFAWYASQGFIGHQLAAIVAQHWLIDKVCSMPARDAIRNGFEVSLTGVTTPDHLAEIKKANRRFQINKHMREFVRKGNIFGVRICIYKVRSSDPKYYERPFNIDGVTPGSYQGMVQVDPYWATPQLDMLGVSDPASANFYEPEWWTINGVNYHKSHLAIFRTEQPADFLKPSYLYGGVPVPQQIMERVYAAERTANEAPQLAATKRTLVWNTDIAAVLGNQTKFAQHMANFINLRDNYGVKVNDTDDTMQQFDTTLTDVDTITNGQYQLVAAAGKVPVCKLMGTSPKGGLGANGDYEEASYHERLEDIQENDLTPMLERHLELVLRSVVEPKFGDARGSLVPHIDWNPVDSPTAEERATRNKTKAEADNLLVTIGAIDAMDVRNRIRTDQDSGYFGIEDAAEDDPIAALEAATAELEALAGPGAPGDLDAATRALQFHPLEAAIAALSGQDGFDLPTAAGVILTRANGDVLWLKRSPYEENEPGKWSWPGGKIDHGEKPQDAAIRELLEETGIDYGAPIIPVGMVGEYIVFAAVSVATLDVRLNDEHTEYQWRPLSDPPKPLHRGAKAFLNG
jgi:uncharacterized protein